MAEPVVATYSIVACDLEAGQWGVATQSKFLAVGSLVPWAEAEVGAVATQAWANPRYGPDGLALLRQGLSAQEVVERLTSADEGREHRQLGVVDARGEGATFTGSQCYDWAGGLAATAGLDLPVVPVRGQIVLTETLAKTVSVCITTSDCYLAQKLHGEMLIGSTTALETRYDVKIQVLSSTPAANPPAMCGRETFAMLVSSTSINVAKVTVSAINQGFTSGGT